MAERTRECVYCGDVFTYKNSRKQYCTYLCSRRHKAGKPLKRPCLNCQTDISHRQGSAKYCASCAVERIPLYHAKFGAKDSYTAHCEWCNEPFAVLRTRKRFCSISCASKSRSAEQSTQISTRACKACTTEFTASSPIREYCSRACAVWGWRYPGIQRILARECRYCYTPFQAKTARQTYCRLLCHQSAGNARRRARLADAFIEDVNKGVVAERDKWKCLLCGKKVDKNLEWPHPMSWSLDHVIPLHAGGEHSYANAQLTHLTCNLSKQAKIREPQQLALIG